MKLENQVCSLELAKKLKGLGIKQESLFQWSWDNEDYRLVYNKPHLDLFAAFTVAELGEMLSKYDEPLPHIGDEDWYWYKGEEEIGAKTEANARAEMLIYLLETN